MTFLIGVAVGFLAFLGLLALLAWLDFRDMERNGVW